MSEDKRNLPKGILAIGAHPDDIELGCGGMLAKYTKAGVEIFVLVLTKGELLSVKKGADRVEESTRALSILGVKNVSFCDFPDTRVYGKLPEAILFIESFCKKHNPQRVYTMSQKDRHQDHWSTYLATMAACKNIPQLLCYETPSTLASFSPLLFEDITSLLELKIEALGNHGSQRDKSYMQKNAISTRAKFRGLQTNVGAAEAFEVCRLLF